LFLLDEVDKMAMDFRGDPSAALLEVLDPEQNAHFSDHYIEVPFDLSQVMFITTANVLHTIPKPLLDRMETIVLPGYTEEEKLHIAWKFLWPKQMKSHGLKPDMVEISQHAISDIIRHYTREAGVRQLERQLGAVCRKVAREIVKGNPRTIRVSVTNLEKYLGRHQVHHAAKESQDEIGIVTGLAVTEAGGDVMPIEVTTMPGKGQLNLTGQLGDVMQESARAAYSYIRSRARKFGIDPSFHETLDLHVHVPEGAIPKDGPSAGIAMATAMVSALSNVSVKAQIAMSGEITLRGHVLPVGGIKEKTLAAHRAGIRELILPQANENDLDDLPRNVKRSMTIHFVKHLDSVLEFALSETIARVKVVPQK
jgi:ATP-dependent Lon protease